MRQRVREKPGHPGDGAWRAYLDGELPLFRRLRLRAHLNHCEPCRTRLETVEAVGARTSRLIGGLASAPNLADSWARLLVLSGRARRPGFSPLSAFLAGGLSVATVTATVLLLIPAPTRYLARVHGVAAFANVFDECCSQPADAGPLQEGVLTLDLPGFRLPLRVHYADVDGSGTLTSGDVIRAVAREPRR